MAIAEFAHNVTELSSSDVGKQLAHSLAGLAEVQRKAQDLQSLQSEQDVVTLLSTGKNLFPSVIDIV
jgi:sorting nexin-1/2